MKERNKNQKVKCRCKHKDQLELISLLIYKIIETCRVYSTCGHAFCGRVGVTVCCPSD